MVRAISDATRSASGNATTEASTTTVDFTIVADDRAH